MADLSDVETALELAVSAAIYPNGITQPSVSGKPTRVYRGWPLPQALDIDLAAGTVNVSVFPMEGLTRNTTRFPPVAKLTAAPACTLTAAVIGATATFAGTCAVGQIAGVSYGTQAWAYAVQAGDTPATVALALSALVPGSTASGAAITLQTNAPVLARAMIAATTSTENERQDQGLRISVWCPDPQSRDATASAIGSALAAIRFLPLPDGSAAWVRYRSTTSFDTSENANLYRRDLIYMCEYATTFVQQAQRVLFGIANVDSLAAPLATEIVVNLIAETVGGTATNPAPLSVTVS